MTETQTPRRVAAHAPAAHLLARAAGRGRRSTHQDGAHAPPEGRCRRSSSARTPRPRRRTPASCARAASRTSRHPVAVAQILADLGIGAKTIAAALLHDTVEDTDYTLDLVRADFGDEIAMLVDGVTKLDKLKYGDSAQAETVRKMVVAMSKDIRVLVIKLADRLHNARTWGFVPEESRDAQGAGDPRDLRAARAPARHPGDQVELEDLSFAVLHPKLYVEIESLVAQRTPQREEFMQEVIDAVNDDLKAAQDQGQGRRSPEAVLLDLPEDDRARPRLRRDLRPGRHPRARELGARLLRGARVDPRALDADPGPVQGLHRDPEVQPVPVAAHHGHRPAGQGGRDPDPHARDAPARRVRCRGALEVQGARERRQGRRPSRAGTTPTSRGSPTSPTGRPRPSDPGEFLDNLRFEIGAKEVYVFTPQGKVIGLPTGATPVDFAYAVHTEVGHRTMGAKVNGRLVPLDSELTQRRLGRGLHVEEPRCRPEPGLAQLRREPASAQQDPRWFTKERREEAIEQGKDAIARAMRKQNLPLQKLMSQDTLTEVAALLRYEDVSALYAAVGEGHVSTQSVIEKVVASLQTEAESEDAEVFVAPKGTRAATRNSDSGVLVRGAPDILVKLAKCCTPVPGDEIVGFVTRGAGRLGAPRRLQQRQDAAARARADDRGRVGAVVEERVPRADPGRGARPLRAALGRDPRAQREPRQHPVGDACRPRAIASRSAGSCSRWATRRISTAC